MSPCPTWCVLDRDDGEWETHMSAVDVVSIAGLDIRGWLEQIHGVAPPLVQVRADGGHLSGSANDLEDLRADTAKVLGQMLMRLHGLALSVVRS